MTAVKPKLVAYAQHAELAARCARAEERCSLLDAELDAARADALALVKLLRRIGGYMPPEDQAVVFAARARLVAAGIVVDEPAVRRTR